MAKRGPQSLKGSQEPKEGPRLNPRRRAASSSGPEGSWQGHRGLQVSLQLQGQGTGEDMRRLASWFHFLGMTRGKWICWKKARAR